MKSKINTQGLEVGYTVGSLGTNIRKVYGEWIETGNFLEHCVDNTTQIHDVGYCAKTPEDAVKLAQSLREQKVEILMMQLRHLQHVAFEIDGDLVRRLDINNH